MTRHTPSKWPLLLLSLAGLAVLAGALWLLADGSEQPERPATEVVRHVEPASPASDGLPSGPGARRSGPQSAAPEQAPLAAQPPPRLGPQWVAGRVFDAERGEPIVGFQVSVLPHGPGDPLSRLSEVEPQPFHQRQGVFSLPAEPGHYDVVIQAPGYLPGVLANVEVPAAHGEPPPVALSRGPAIAGVLLGHDGLPRADVPIFLEVMALADPSLPGPRVTVTRSNVDGGFSFSPLPDGEYAVAALTPGNLEDRVAGVRVYGHPTNVTLRLLPRHLLSLQVQDLWGRPLPGASVELSGAGRTQSRISSASGLAVFDQIADGSYRLKVAADGHAELLEELVLEGGQGDHARWLSLDPLPPPSG